jgi:hypothetical protein
LSRLQRLAPRVALILEIKAKYAFTFRILSREG